MRAAFYYIVLWLAGWRRLSVPPGLQRLSAKYLYSVCRLAGDPFPLAAPSAAPI